MSYAERRRRDLNPRAATNDLLPFQGSPFSHLGTSADDTFYMKFVYQERREWDSNPRALADKRFSRPPRYDHFDISPNVLSYYITLFFVCQELFHLFWSFFFFKNFISMKLSRRSPSLFSVFSRLSAVALSGNERYSIIIAAISQHFFSIVLYFFF